MSWHAALFYYNRLDIIKELRVCDRHYGSLSSRGHKPAKGKSAAKSRSDAQLGVLRITPCIVNCSNCKNHVVISNNDACKKHKIFLFGKLFSVACNFLDELSHKGQI